MVDTTSVPPWSNVIIPPAVDATYQDGDLWSRATVTDTAGAIAWDQVDVPVWAVVTDSDAAQPTPAPAIPSSSSPLVASAASLLLADDDFIPSAPVAHTQRGKSVGSVVGHWLLVGITGIALLWAFWSAPRFFPRISPGAARETLLLVLCVVLASGLMRLLSIRAIYPQR